MTFKQAKNALLDRASKGGYAGLTIRGWKDIHYYNNIIDEKEKIKSK